MYTVCIQYVYVHSPQEVVVLEAIAEVSVGLEIGNQHMACGNQTHPSWLVSMLVLLGYFIVTWRCCVSLCLSSGAQVDDEGVNQWTSLHEVAESGDVELMELLLKEGGADPISRDANNLTPYDIAYNKNNREVGWYHYSIS